MYITVAPGRMLKRLINNAMLKSTPLHAHVNNSSPDNHIDNDVNGHEAQCIVDN